MKVTVSIIYPNFVVGPTFKLRGEQAFEILRQIPLHPYFVEGRPVEDKCTYFSWEMNGRNYEAPFLHFLFHKRYELFEAYSKVDRKWGVKIFIDPPPGDGRALYTTWIVITDAVGGTKRNLGKGADQDNFVQEDWMPNYLLTLIKDAQLIQRQIEVWLEVYT